jgi:hypothetical protein
MQLPDFWKKASSKQKRIYSIIAVFVVAFIAMLAGSLFPLSLTDAEQLSREFNQTFSEASQNPVFIFTNNFRISLLMFIPLVGPAIGLFVLFSTGVVGGALLVTQGLPSYFVLALAATPVFWLEFAAYSIAMAEGVWLARRIWQVIQVKDPRLRWAILKRELKWLALFIGVCAALLAVGAVVEVWIISAFS